MTIPKTEFSIPDDLTIEVLKELPVKSLLRFRCVSKHWLSIIDDPVFVDLHRLRSYSRPGGVSFLIHRNHGFSSDFYSFHPQARSQQPRLICTEEEVNDESQPFASVEGLVCFGNQIWNPCTRKGIDLPPLPIFCSNGKTRIARRWLIRPLYFLGFNQSTKEYKVLSVTRVKEETHGQRRYTCLAKVLTLGTNSWRNLDAPHYDQLALKFNKMTSCCINNLLYIYMYSASFIIAFDVATEQSLIIPFPETMRRLSFSHLQDVRGNLGIVHHDPKMVLILQDEKIGRWKTECTFFPPSFNLNSPWTSVYPPYSHFRFPIDIPDQLNEVWNDRGSRFSFSKHVETLFKLSHSRDL